MVTFRLRFVFVAVLGGMVGAACVVCSQARAASPQSASDKAIVADIQSSLFTDPVLKTLNIHVASQGGAVTLSGTVNTNVEKADVERIASQEPGVKQVIDNLTVSGNSSAGVSASSSGVAPAPARASVTVPAGTPITVQMIDAVDTARNKPGDEFDGSIYSPVVVGNYVAVPQYAKARLRLVDAASAGHLKGRSELALELVSLTVKGTLYEVESNYYEQQGTSRGKQTAERTAGGGLLGTLIGAAADRGKGAGIGAIIGAGGALAIQEATKGQQVKVPSEAKVGFILKAAVTIASATPISAMTTITEPTPSPAASGDLSGMWTAYFSYGGHLKVSVRQAGDKVVSYIVGGDTETLGYYPAGKELFYGTYSAGTITANEIFAGWHYTGPRWCAVTLKVIDANHLTESLAQYCGLYPTTWERANGAAQ